MSRSRARHLVSKRTLNSPASVEAYLQAIADRLNEEGVPTVRGGVKWRHSSVQAAAGYRRTRRTAHPSLPDPKEAAGT